MTITMEPSTVADADRAADTDATRGEDTGSSPAGARWRRLWEGPADDPRWARPALWGLLVATAIFYFWNLTSNGYANQFYSAAVQAGSTNWEAFFYGSLDGANSITVDKPPASLWVMALSVRIFGLNSFAILMPEVLMGIGSVALVYAAVKRYFSATAGLIAGAVLALTPVAVLMFRFNNPDALLTLLMTVAAYATLRAIEHGSIRWFVVAGVAIGFGFLTKTLQVMLVVPGFGLSYLACANAVLRQRILGAVAGVAAMVAAAGWWIAIVELVPASARPYIGGSQSNSFLELTFGYNGLGRINGDEAGSVGPNSGGGSIWRMFTGTVSGQISWFLPTALFLLVMGLVFAARAPRTDLRRASYLVWGSWMVATALTFSLMQGIFHEYYTVALAPAIAAIIGMGMWQAWQRDDKLGSITLAVATALTSVWGFVLLSRTTSYGSLRVIVLAVGIVAALGFLARAYLDKRALPAVVAAAVIAGLAGPAAYSISTVGSAHTGSIVVAGPAGQGGPGRGPGGPPGGGLPGGPPPAGGNTNNGTAANGNGANGTGAGPGAGSANQGATGNQGAANRGRGGMGGLLNGTSPSSEVVTALQANASEFTWAAAAVGSQNAAGLQLGSGLPVMAIGGFNGSDPSPTLEQFQAYVKDGEIHYFLAGGGFGRQNGGSNISSQINQWVSANYTQVTIGSYTFYDFTQPLAA